MWQQKSQYWLKRTAHEYGLSNGFRWPFSRFTLSRSVCGPLRCAVCRGVTAPTPRPFRCNMCELWPSRTGAHPPVSSPHKYNQDCKVQRKVLRYIQGLGSPFHLLGHFRLLIRLLEATDRRGALMTPGYGNLIYGNWKQSVGFYPSRKFGADFADFL